jgi:hypothetical protein
MAEKSKFGFNLVIDIGVLIVLASVCKAFGDTGTKIYGFIFLCYCYKWGKQYYRSKTICGSCSKRIPKEAAFCPFCGSNWVTTIGALKQREDEQKQKKLLADKIKIEEATRLKTARNRYKALQTAKYCSHCDGIYESDYIYCMKCQSKTVALPKETILGKMKKEFPGIVSEGKDLDLLLLS